MNLFWFISMAALTSLLPFFSFSSYVQLKNRGMPNYCFDYNPPNDHNVVGNRIILYPCHGMGQNQVGGFRKISTIRAELPSTVNVHLSIIFFSFFYVSNIFTNCPCQIDKRRAQFISGARSVFKRKTLWFWWLIL